MNLKKGDIVSLDLPDADSNNPTHVQQNSRPALVIQKQDNPKSSVITLIPFTKNQNAINYQPSMKVPRSFTNGLTEDSILLILQLGAFDKGDISGKQGKLEDVYLKEANKLVRELLGF